MVKENAMLPGFATINYSADGCPARAIMLKDNWQSVAQPLEDASLPICFRPDRCRACAGAPASPSHRVGSSAHRRRPINTW
jgi:hypothetical protein